jgi:hypothetical protein
MKMVYYDGNGERRDVNSLKELIKIAKRVKREKEYGAAFFLNALDCVYVEYSTALYTKDGKPGGFCLLWSNGNGYRAVKPYAYKSAAVALKALSNC